LVYLFIKVENERIERAITDINHPLPGSGKISKGTSTPKGKKGFYSRPYKKGTPHWKSTFYFIE
jgi:hypothetical protein